MSVIDNGIGIKARYVDRIAEPFFQVDGTQARRHEGTGLGLTLCKMFVELHGGSLIITSEFGEGTTVAARFPAEIAQDAGGSALPRRPTVSGVLSPSAASPC